MLIRAAELHDVGKVAVPDLILNKPGPLDDAEWAIMRQHTVAGERILGTSESMRPVARVVRASHERWDGRGYPDGIAGDAIPLEARIVCACDAYDAMRSVRAYKDAMTHEASASPSCAAAPERSSIPVSSRCSRRSRQTLTHLCQGSATLASNGRAHHPRSS